MAGFGWILNGPTGEVDVAIAWILGEPLLGNLSALIMRRNVPSGFCVMAGFTVMVWSGGEGFMMGLSSRFHGPSREFDVATPVR